VPARKAAVRIRKGAAPADADDAPM
jgi:hypothetical protein